MLALVSGRIPVAEDRGHLQGQIAAVQVITGRGGRPPSIEYGSQLGRENQRWEENQHPPRLTGGHNMTLIKSFLLGSAAGIVAVASAQAADLPTRKAAPVEYVRICNVGGITGWTLPGSDTCVKFSGYITAQFEGGNLETQYNWGSISDLAPTGKAGTATVGGVTVTTPGVSTPLTGVPAAVSAAAIGAFPDSRQTQRVLIASNSTQLSNT